ncbi:HtrA2 peptidase [Calothrix sp. NIES-3974]|nr:HtrA2 peptidase [Calothrix sp. NIES-3974]
MIKLSKLSGSIRQFLTHLLAIAFGAIFTFTSLQVPASQAEPAPNLSMEVAQSQSSANMGGGSRSFVTAAVNRVGPAVVRIDTERTITRSIPDPFFDDPFFRRFFGDIPRQSQQQQRGLGSGFIFDRSGLVLTNAHVVDKADRVSVRLKDGRTFAGQVLGEDEVTDLAVVKINAGNDLPVAPLGSSANVQVGDWAIAVGNPLGLDNTVTLGIVSTLRRSSAQVGLGGNRRLEFIQTDAAINPGNSGGPLVNGNGEVIGINTAIRGDAMGIGFAIPIDRAKSIAAQLQRGEQVAHPFIGVGMDDITPEKARRLNADPNSPLQIAEVNGILVVRVVPNSPAANAGIRIGDVITEVDGKRITKSDELLNIVEASRVGQTLQFKIQRGNRTLQISLRTAQLRDIS